MRRAETVGMRSEQLDRIEPVMQDFVDTKGIRGIHTLVSRRGELVHSASVGHRDAEAGEAMTADTIFRIYSMTKPVVSTALMVLFEEGRFLLEDPVARDGRRQRLAACLGDLSVDGQLHTPTKCDHKARVARGRGAPSLTLPG